MARAKREGAWVHVEGWTGEHGRVWKNQDGTLHFHIRKRIGGVRCEVATGATTLKAAIAHLNRFEADPGAYRPAGAERKEPVPLDNALAVEFLTWSLREKRNSAKWVGQQRLYLAWWMEKLARVDLRRASLHDHILPALRGATCRPQRIATLKVLFSWLRTEKHAISAAEDPTFGTLKVPQSVPEQRRRSKALPREHVALAIERLGSDRWRDLLRVLAGTGTWRSSSGSLPVEPSSPCPAMVGLRVRRAWSSSPARSPARRSASPWGPMYSRRPGACSRPAPSIGRS